MICRIVFALMLPAFPDLYEPALIFNIGIGTIPEGPALPVGVTCTVLIDLSTVRIQKPGLWELFKALYNVIEA